MLTVVGNSVITQTEGVNKHRSWMCGGRDKRTGINCTATIIPEPTLMAVSTEILGIVEFDGKIFTEKIAHEERLLTFIFKDLNRHAEATKRLEELNILRTERIGKSKTLAFYMENR